MPFFEEYIVLVVVGICAIVGFVIKNIYTNDKVNRFIPLIVCVLGVIINGWLNHFLWTPTVILGGMASGLASTGMHELVNNLMHAPTVLFSDISERDENESSRGNDDE